LAIGDIHGCSRALDVLLASVAPTADDLIITLGDYVDRGLDSYGVVERILRLSQSHRLVALRGNHEEMMLNARDDRDHRRLWIECGGDTTLMSYASPGEDGRLSDVPDQHWHFIEETCVDFFETHSHFFVHAGARHDLPLERQSPLLLRWQTFDDPPPHVNGKVMICGHTAQKSGEPRHVGHAICIDTHAHGGGWLTCLDVISGEMWQANERGAVRRGRIGDYLV
jgi:serine/threonine protein phosphatase 1